MPNQYREVEYRRPLKDCAMPLEDWLYQSNNRHIILASNFELNPLIIKII